MPCSGMVILWFLNPIVIAEIGVVLGQPLAGVLDLASTPREPQAPAAQLRPGWLQQVGTLCCGIFFLAVSIAVILTLKPK